MKRDIHGNRGGVSLGPGSAAVLTLEITSGIRVDARRHGCPGGTVWVSLHGGPGSGAQPSQLLPFDLGQHAVWLPDQRGAGRSSPRGGRRQNNLNRLVRDLEALRVRAGVTRWSIVGGSWGTVLALAYAGQHPQQVERLVLRGAFAGRREEIRRALTPRTHAHMRQAQAVGWPLRAGVPLAVTLRRLDQLLSAKRPSTQQIRLARFWQALEGRLALAGVARSVRYANLSSRVEDLPAMRRQFAAMHRSLLKREQTIRIPRRPSTDFALWNKFRIQAHYLRHHGFTSLRQLDAAVRTAAQHGLPIDWIHGRFDTVCPPGNSRRWAALGAAISPADSVRLFEPACGHLGVERAMVRQLRACIGG